MEVKELAKALAAAQAEFGAAVKDSRNLFFKSNYADLASVDEACGAALSKHGIAVTQTLAHREYGWVLITTLWHTSGESISGEYPIITVNSIDKTTGREYLPPTTFLASVTYARRGALQAMVKICPTDDDGNEASGRHADHKQTTVHTTQVKPSSVSTDETESKDRKINNAELLEFKKIREKIGWSPNDFLKYVHKKYQKEPGDLTLSEFKTIKWSLAEVPNANAIKAEMKDVEIPFGE